ncbi:glucose-1-phosphate cytidylyltransferase [Halobacteriovorax marinus]|uniref:Glucose-1-phosphate cytidylyltransferase n=1 Tax=Halobacteriovorax marinus TaxID=97084 RepID=A0A1Y5FHH3_9BACT|nr:glucose-1-phosphate cytidylyltransferase [Halobacteriovorax marinus]
MKVLILAGGYGTRISEETGIRPKPMVEVGEKPILWHIMKHYSSYGFNEFVILCGYKGNCIKEYFANYFVRQSSVTFDLANNSMEIINSDVENWKVTCLDTGDGTLTGGRIKRAQEVVGNEPFMLTYGDGVSDVDIKALVESHKESGRACTMTAVQPDGRFGALEFDDKDQLTAFKEKPQGEVGWINGGFFVCQPEVFDEIKDGDRTIFERAPLEKLASSGQVNSYKHDGFWKCMDTLADKQALTKMWESGEAKWKTW